LERGTHPASASAGLLPRLTALPGRS